MDGIEFDVVKSDSPCLGIGALLCFSEYDATSANGTQFLHEDITRIAFEDLADLNLNLYVNVVARHGNEVRALEKC